jgi:hypothetical protein
LRIHFACRMIFNFSCENRLKYVYCFPSEREVCGETSTIRLTFLEIEKFEAIAIEIDEIDRVVLWSFR